MGFVEKNNRALRNEIRKARQLSNGSGLLGVNIMVALSNFTDLARTAIEEGIDFIFAGAGLPLNLPLLATDRMPTKLVPIVSSGRAARIIAKRWTEKYNYVPDAFVVEGPLAGGHLGFKMEQIDRPGIWPGEAAPGGLRRSAPAGRALRKARSRHRRRRHLHGGGHLSIPSDGRSRGPNGHPLRHHSRVRCRDRVQTGLSGRPRKISSSSRARWACRAGPCAMRLSTTSMRATASRSNAPTTASSSHREKPLHRLGPGQRPGGADTRLRLLRIQWLPDHRDRLGGKN